MSAEAPGKLVLVGTPLGNRGDLSPRAREAIVGADVLFCEDTRSPLRLLGEGATLPPRISCFVANEGERVALLLENLERGKVVAYVSEAGLPVWSDPGLRLVQAAVEAGYPVDVVPGPTAAAVALCLSGLPADDVRFLGFLPRGGPERAERLESIARERGTVLLYEAGNRVPALLRDLAAALPDAESRRVAIGRELTKQHQEVLRGSLAELAQTVDEALRGEVTLVLAGTHVEATGDPAQEAARALWQLVCDPGLKPREKAKQIAALTGLEARAIYEQLGALRRGGE
ncbi:16S rRNA (cytidine1402-2'-O)-methyltransferase [Nannocystis exedens]|uniref:16S rRNA (Cytidine1402-2'-O)-methyltransferase n=1 Tax=Nannocystis exedens TaxID=54 RepID=A0A1I2GGV5_9BACT|nr:16S rRNA (cytidine(1402)-2'-O)-methyltransferase [Nannocystis exedens]PCC69957.1 rRNA (cytidine-2'-O-)-methyltransferase [Nannocystis exedens]SFF16289.1 16S rRNA (cytidine1402-2'-O)-methyltransferase [Nannocystis exedens]